MLKDILNNYLNKPLNEVTGKVEHQNAFETLFNISLLGLNIGTGSFTEESGEIYVLNYIKNKIKSDLIVFDVGANIGNYSKLILDICRGQLKQLHAFEPSKKTFETYCQNIKDSRVIYNNIGIGNTNDKVLLYSDKDCSGLASIYNRKLDHFNISLSQNETIQIKTLYSYITEKDVTHIDLLKMDIEGNELYALIGLGDYISRVKFVQFEFGGCNISSRTFFQDFYYLLSPQFNIYRIVQNGLVPITQYKDTLEIFTTTNFLAENKNIN